MHILVFMLRILSTALYKPEVCVAWSSYGYDLLWQFVPSRNNSSPPRNVQSKCLQARLLNWRCFPNTWYILAHHATTIRSKSHWRIYSEGLFCFLYSDYFPVWLKWNMSLGLLMVAALLGFSQAASTCGKLRSGVKLVETRGAFVSANLCFMVTRC